MASDLIIKMLKWNAEERPSAGECLKHHFVADIIF